MDELFESSFSMRWTRGPSKSPRFRPSRDVPGVLAKEKPMGRSVIPRTSSQVTLVLSNSPPANRGVKSTLLPLLIRLVLEGTTFRAATWTGWNSAASNRSLRSASRRRLALKPPLSLELWGSFVGWDTPTVAMLPVRVAMHRSPFKQGCEAQTFPSTLTLLG